MSRIKIKNFGPIRKGFVENDGWLDINKVTVFIGNQGSGKSTIAKLISIFSWLEKNVVRNSISIDKLNTDIFNNLCVQQEMLEYFAPDTYISYEGDACDFEYSATEYSFKFKGNINSNYPDYVLPKIQYVSAARNLLTILYNISIQNIVDKDGNIIDLSSNIPFMVRDLNKEYMRALVELAKDGFSLPVNDTIVYFQNHNTFIKTKGKRVSMSAAASGIQSITPLLIVSHFLANEVQKDVLDRIQAVDNNLKRQIEYGISKNEKMSDLFNQLISFGKGILTDNRDIEQMREVLRKFIPSSFVNIVEEPEQNLFPSSQQSVIYSLLEFNNAVKNNKLIIATHSPYIIGYLSLAVKAQELYKKTLSDDVERKIGNIVPKKSAINHYDLVIYELDENKGTIKKLDNYKGIPSSKNYLNQELAEKNEMYSQLLDIEDLCK